jgi:uncharacterized membrane-anchored protein YjiN (DUF445 family)
MCLLCIEIAKGKMTTKEMVRAYVEVANNPHATEVLEVLEKNGKLDEFQDTLLELAAKELEDEDGN